MKTIRIAFIGSDGTGKTTTLHYVKQQLEQEGKKAGIVVMGWKDFRNPILKAFSKRHIRRTQAKKINEERLARFRPRSFLFYCIYYSELLYRYAVTYLSKNKIILYDRYFYDELAFAREKNFSFFSMLTPRPDICFLLRVPLSTIKKRGHYATQQRYSYFYTHMQRLSQIFPLVPIDSSKPLNEIYKEIDSHISQLKST